MFTGVSRGIGYGYYMDSKFTNDYIRKYLQPFVYYDNDNTHGIKNILKSTLFEVINTEGHFPFYYVDVLGRNVYLCFINKQDNKLYFKEYPLYSEAGLKLISIIENKGEIDIKLYEKIECIDIDEVKKILKLDVQTSTQPEVKKELKFRKKDTSRLPYLGVDAEGFAVYGRKHFEKITKYHSHGIEVRNSEMYDLIRNIFIGKIIRKGEEIPFTVSTLFPPEYREWDKDELATRMELCVRKVKTYNFIFNHKDNLVLMGQSVYPAHVRRVVRHIENFLGEKLIDWDKVLCKYYVQSYRDTLIK